MAINGYHHTPGSKDWRANTQLDGNFVGLELETHNENGREVTDEALVDSGISYKGVSPICETDASISYDKGIEVICPPVSLANCIKAGGFVDKIVDVLRDAGVTEEPANNYGMHMNINVRNWTAQDKSLHMFVLRCLKDIAQTLGKRPAEANAVQNPTYWNPWNAVNVDDTGVMYTGLTKYNPSWVRGHGAVMEVRYPKAVLTFNHIKANISFVYSIRSFLCTPAGQWTAFYAATAGHAATTARRTKITAAVKQVYLSWLKNQRNFRNLYNAIDIEPENPRAYTLAAVKEYLADTVPFSNTALQEQAEQWCTRAARSNPIAAAA